jgi:hypothetical protein
MGDQIIRTSMFPTRVPTPGPEREPGPTAGLSFSVDVIRKINGDEAQLEPCKSQGNTGDINVRSWHFSDLVAVSV